MQNNGDKNPSSPSKDRGKAYDMDLPDSTDDKKQMEIKEVTIDLPEVSEIPGQEHIIPPKMNSFADTTIASDGEEGIAIFGEEQDELKDEG